MNTLFYHLQLDAIALISSLSCSLDSKQAQ